MENCSHCSRPLQVSAICEITGICDRCRDERTYALERTDIANTAFVATVEKAAAERRSVRQWFEDLFRTDPDNCGCFVCQENWQDDLDRWERLG